MQLTMSVVSHVPLPGAGYVEDPIPSGYLRDALHRSRQDVARFIVPDIFPGVIPELSIVDPNRCSCLQYVGAEKIKPFQLTPSSDIQYDGCRSDGFVHPRKQLWCVLGRTHEHGHYGEAPDVHTHQWNQISYPGTGRGTHTRVMFNTCPNGSTCLQATYDRVMYLGGNDNRQITPSFYQALDPDSYTLKTDSESFGIFWCESKDCRNYYRYQKDKLPYPLVDIHRKCSDACPEQIWVSTKQGDAGTKQDAEKHSHGVAHSRC